MEKLKILQNKFKKFVNTERVEKSFQGEVTTKRTIHRKSGYSYDVRYKINRFFLHTLLYTLACFCFKTKFKAVKS